MSWAEHALKEKYESMGYDVIQIGKPDLILLKDGEIEFVEVKVKPDKLNKAQRHAIKLLKKHGFEAHVKKLSMPTIPKKYISPDEQLKIILQCQKGDLEPYEIYNLIIRSQQYPTLNDFTQNLIAYFNNSHDEDESETFSF